jgi:vanadium chloroperoxidase
MYENAVSRVFLGVHWRFDGLLVDKASDILKPAKLKNTGGVPLGRRIAQDIWKNGIKPSPKSARCSLGAALLASMERTDAA